MKAISSSSLQMLRTTILETVSFGRSSLVSFKPASFKSTRMTFAPAFAKVTAHARPIPDPAPAVRVI